MENLKKKLKTHLPQTALILGSGWNRFVKSVNILNSWDYQEIFKVKSTVPGHSGKLIHGLVDKKPILIMAGRFHIYEGHTAFEATSPIRLFKQLAINNLIVTAACGALNPKYQVGDFVLLTDLLTLFTPTPLKGAQFQDMSQVFNSKLQAIAQEQLTNLNLPFQKGVYCYYHGPQYETPADKMALRHLGADVVGMSTVPETIMASWKGIKVLGLSFVTNLAFVKHSHKEVISEAQKASSKMSVLLKNIVTLI